MSAHLEVLVTGATGRQGGAVARALLARGHRVRALTRSITAPAAVRLRHLGATLVRGSLTDPASLERAMAGVRAVFAMTTPLARGSDTEVQQGLALADSAVVARVPHFVYSSIASAFEAPHLPQFDGKARVEQYLRRQDLPFTIIAPVLFMENLLSPWVVEGLSEDVLWTDVPPQRRVQQLAVADLGHFVARVLEQRSQFLGRRVEIASDELSAADQAEILSRLTHRIIRCAEVPIEALREESGERAETARWLDRVGFRVDLHALHAELPSFGWHPFEAWARRQPEISSR
ncbi:MAG: NmrA/HSCARG family protein [Deltaproteobacteria bacterium]|nr:NmrA/HSCARG family protein [Deltaproteobacteria bacterium]